MTEMQEGAPRGAFLPSSLMYLYSGAPMHLCPGVDMRPSKEGAYIPENAGM